jgi:hypothetical protein
LPSDLRAAEDAFGRVLEALEPAKAALADTLPGTRMPGRPMDDALAAFVEGLTAAETTMDRWRHPAVQEAWLACDEGLRRSLDRARRVTASGPEVEGFEGLLGLVTWLLDPLDPFADAETRFRDLRSGRVRSY